MILDWKENLTEEEMPPSWMWHLDEELAPWMEDVHRARQEKFGSNDSSRETADMMSNELARDRRK